MLGNHHFSTLCEESVFIKVNKYRLYGQAGLTDFTGKAFRTGAEAGVTRKLTGTVKIYEEPNIYVYDTPGVMVPFLGHGVDVAERRLNKALTGLPIPTFRAY